MSYLQRVKFDELQNRFKQYGIEVQPSYLRYETELQNGVNHYPFAFEPSPNDSKTEIKLNKNDLFYVTGFTMGYIVYGTGTPATEGAANVVVTEAFAPLKTYAETAGLEALYNGFLKITTGSKINIENLATINFKYVPENLTSGVTQPEFQNDKVQFANVSDLMLAGTKSHTISLDIPALPVGVDLVPSTATTAAGNLDSVKVKAVLILNGFLMKNGAITAQMENF